MDWIEELVNGIRKVGKELERMRMIMEDRERREKEKDRERQGRAEGGGEIEQQEGAGRQLGSEEWWEVPEDSEVGTEERRVEEEITRVEETSRDEEREGKVREVEKSNKGRGEKREEESHDEKSEGGGGTSEAEGERREKKAKGGDLRAERMMKWIEEMAERNLAAERKTIQKESKRDRGSTMEEDEMAAERKEIQKEGKKDKGSTMEEEEMAERSRGGGERAETWERVIKRREEEIRRRREERGSVKEEKEQREKELEDKKRIERRRRLIWRGVDGKDMRERRELVEAIAERVLRKGKTVREVTEGKGEGGRIILRVKMESEKDRDELLERGWYIKENWEVGLDEELTMEERKARWRIIEKARMEKARGKRVRVTNRKLWIEGEEWRWSEEEKKWEKV